MEKISPRKSGYVSLIQKIQRVMIELIHLFDAVGAVTGEIDVSAFYILERFRDIKIKVYTVEEK